MRPILKEHADDADASQVLFEDDFPTCRSHHWEWTRCIQFQHWQNSNPRIWSHRSGRSFQGIFLSGLILYIFRRLFVQIYHTKH